MVKKEYIAPILLVEGQPRAEFLALRAYANGLHRNRLLVARTSNHALTLLKGCATGLAFGLVLMDINLSMIGSRSLVTEIRSLPSIASVPVVVMADDEHADAFAKCATEGADEWVSRPASVAGYQALFDHLVDRWLVAKPA